ncbi:MAG: polysaccharide biosynthesis/export family protein [Deltaproteobacteria bacterium]|nr:polysaccharide biosynthesis/export family protein [Deltaproteobacteria bacterium]
MKSFGLIISLIIATTIFPGCASTDANKKGGLSGEPMRDEQGIGVGDIPALKVSEFILGVGDTIEISVYRHDDLKKSVKIDASGKVMFPLIGDIKAAGVGIYKFRDEMQTALAKYIVDPQVTISITAIQSQKVMVLGEVGNPGILTLDSELSVMEAISKAGGMTDDAKLSNVLLIRRVNNKPDVLSLDLKKAFKDGDLSQNKRLQGGDIVYLPAVMIANVSWYFGHLSKILSPIVSLESGIVLWPQVESVLKGTSTDKTTTIIPTR